MHARSGPWDLVFISGDLTQEGSAKEFGLLSSTLDSLWGYLRSLGSNPSLLAVPGSRDFWQGHHSSLPDVRYRVSEVRHAFRYAKTGEIARRIRGALGPFSAWFDTWRNVHPSPVHQGLRGGLLPGDFVATLDAAGSKVGVVGLNSILRGVTASIDTKGMYELDLEQVETVMGGSARDWAREHDVVLLLTHHPPSMMRSNPLARIQEALTPSNGILLHVCGSRLQRGGSSPLRVSGGSHVIQAPSLFGGLGGTGTESAAEEPWHLWGYTAGVLELSGLDGLLRLFPRSVVSVTQGEIALGPDARWVSGPDDAFETPLAALRGRPGAADAERPPRAAGMAADFRAVRSEPAASQLPPGVKFQTLLETGHKGVVTLAWAPAGDALGMGLVGGDIAYWKPALDVPDWVASAHISGLKDFCFSPDGQFLASRSQYNVRMWRADGAQNNKPPALVNEGRRVAWSSTGLLATDVGQGRIQLWNTRTWAETGRVQLPLSLSEVYALSWSPDGQMLVCGGEGVPVLAIPKAVRTSDILDARQLTGLAPGRAVLDLAWMPGWSSVVAMACRDSTIYIRDVRQPGFMAVLEGHRAGVMSVSFSHDGRLLASRSSDGAIRLWRTDTWESVAELEAPSTSPQHAGLAFSPVSHVLASVGPGGRDVRLWELDLSTLLRSQAPSQTVHEVSAKVVLVGEGRAGKSCLALRMVKDEYEELDSTHGMRFWSMPAEPSSGDGPTSGPRREIILWDLGGQSEYQLVHQLFLRDSTVALMVMEPGRGEGALDEVEGWNRRLQAQSGERSIRTLLVGTKVDHAESPVNRPSLEGLVQRLGFESYVLTSAKKGQGITELKAALGRAIDWDSLQKVSRPELFQYIRQLIQRLREAKRVVLTFFELEGELRRELGSAFDPEALQAVVGHLTRQGRVADTRMAGGTRVLILEVEQLERYAGSLIVAARENPHGVPAIEVAKVLSPKMKFPRIKDEERLTEDQELAVLNCVIELLIEHGVCLRHEGLLIFPSLFQPAPSGAGADFSHAISLHYDFFGPIDNIYASLVTSLAISQRFGPMRLWEDRAEFRQVGMGASGIRRVRSRSQDARGMAQLDVYFDDDGTDPKKHELFVNFIEQHLREHGVELLERLTITCACGKVFPEETVRNRLARGLPDVGCEACDHRTPITLGAQQSRELNPELVKQVQALRTTIREQLSQSVTETKVLMTEAKTVNTSQETPIRILHLSDLHIGAGDDPLSLLQPLMADLQDRSEGLGVERLDYLVISGDITNRASPQEFEKAREFVSRLIEQFGLTAERCILVPGNHDLDWNTEVYDWQKKRLVDKSRLVTGRYHEAGEGYLIRNETKYPERFKNFSEHFYHPLIQKPYPLAPEEQCIPFFFSESRIQFLAMNSAWEIDEYFKERSSVSDNALSRGLDRARQDIARARERGELTGDAKVLRLAVWHHPITGNEKIQGDAFMKRLLQADVRVCLHGHVHEDRADLVNHLHSERRIHVMGAGSFGAPTYERPESVPRLFNLLEVQRDLQRLRVHTRCLRKQGGAWEGWAAWPGEKPSERRTYYEVPLS
ncbi:metallophosphoesterase [Archangium violaceum]|uniref:metallophosphoesterase n=1 Tax=Archangium violaceum TaxID=83451 RepID=UPI002B280068|nr:metallophosphoesterase [Archangium gephyra]